MNHKLNDAEKALAQKLAIMVTIAGGNGLQASKKFGFCEPTLWGWRNGRKSPNRKNFDKLKRTVAKLETK